MEKFDKIIIECCGCGENLDTFIEIATGDIEPKFCDSECYDMYNEKTLLNKYEKYMKTVTDGFASICSYHGAESLLIDDGDKISVMIYAQKEYLLNYDLNLKHLYRGEAYNKRVEDFQKERTKRALIFLNENKLSYDDWKLKNL